MTELLTVAEVAALATKGDTMTARAKVAAILESTPGPGSWYLARQITSALTPHWMALWAAAEAVGEHHSGEGQHSQIDGCWRTFHVALAALNAAAESEVES